MVLFALGFSIKDFANDRLPSPSEIESLIGGKAQETTVDMVVNVDTSIRNQFDGDVDPQKLKYAALSGMVASLGDPHTVFMPPVDLKSFDATTSANFYGIGCSLLTDPRGVKIEKVFDDGAAHKVGLQPGDIIIGVNGKSVGGVNSTKIVDMIRGPEGTSVELKILPNGKPPAKIVHPVRSKVFVPTVAGHYFPDQQVGYLAIATFSEPTVTQFDQELSKLRAHPLKGLIIDLRSDPGGLLETACELIGRFVSDKVVVTMHRRNDVLEAAKSPAGETIGLTIPIAILINRNTASAAEIFSGAMRDYGLAVLVGNHSYGKASVQNLFPLRDGAGLKVTIAKYMLPFSPDISRKEDEDGNYVSGGLKPDLFIAMPADAIPLPFDPKTDPQLNRALQYLVSAKS